MDFSIYKKIFAIYTEEKNQSKVTRFIATAFLWIISLSILFFVFEVKASNFVYYYAVISIVLELLLLFVFMVLYESTESIVYFCKNFPVSPNKIFLFHFRSTSLTSEIIVECGIVFAFLITFAVPIKTIIVLFFFILSLKFIRTYSELFILWFKKYQVNFPYLSLFIFLALLILYLNANSMGSIVSTWNFTIVNLAYIIGMLLIIVLITAGPITSSLIKEKSNNKNIEHYFKFTQRFSNLAVKMIKCNSLRSLTKYNIVRLARDPKYVGKLLTISSTLIVFQLLYNFFPQMRFNDLLSNHNSIMIYMGFFIVFLNLNSIKIEYGLQQKMRMKSLPISLRLDRIAADLSSNIFLILAFSFLLLLITIVGDHSYSSILYGYKSFFCFLLLSLCIESMYKYTITKKKKFYMFISYLIIGLTIEAYLISDVNWVVQVAIFLILIVTLYFSRYRLAGS